jgi:hypothetical protein
MNIRNLEGFRIQPNGIGGSGGDFAIQAFYYRRFRAIGYFDVHLKAFRKVQKYSTLRNRLDPEQLTQRDVGDLFFSRCNFEKSLIHRTLYRRAPDLEEIKDGLRKLPTPGHSGFLALARPLLAFPASAKLSPTEGAPRS